MAENVLFLPPGAAESADTGAEADIVEDAGCGQADREAHPDACSTEFCLEAEQICGRNRNEIIAYESHNHNRLHILYSPKSIAEAQLQSVSELIGEQDEKQRDCDGGNLCGVSEHTHYAVSEYIDEDAEECRNP